MLARRIALLVTSTLLTLLFAELVCRLLPSTKNEAARDALPWFRTDFFRVVDDPRGYDIRPNASAQINSLGMRGPERTATKPPMTFRVWVVGDSIAFGSGVNHIENFSAVLEKRLRKKRLGPRIEVLNSGVAGYNTRQELCTIQLQRELYDPDLVVLTWCPNDVQVTPVIFKEGDDFRAYRPGASELLFGGKLFEHSALYRHVAALWVGVSANDDGDLEDNFAALTEIGDTLEAAKVPLLVVLFPYLAPGPERYPPRLKALRDRAKETLAASNVPYIDLLEEWANRSFEELRIPNDRSDIVHPNAIGHEDVAARIEAWILEHGLISAAR